MILVVHHDSEVLEQARQILNRDRQVFLASTTEHALKMVRHLPFSVVLVDLDLPEDPFALMRRLHDADPELLMIAINGSASSSVLEATKALGVVEVLKSPISPEWKPVVESVRARRLRS